MIRLWKMVVLILMALTIRYASAEEIGLAITSNLPGASISVDDVYRGTTPPQSGDALSIQVPEGMRVISARKRHAGQDYTAQQTLEVTPGQNNRVRLELQPPSKPAVVAVPVAPLVQSEVTKPEQILPRSRPEVPGKNF